MPKGIATTLTHGHARRNNTSSTYTIWCLMLARCYNENVKEYRYYGGRGIIVCESWRRFENFLKDMGERPKDKCLERIDNDGDYEPSNCRWASRLEQARNKSNSRLITLNGETHCVGEWSEILRIPTQTIHNRIARDWPAWAILKRGQFKSVKQVF